MTPLRSISFIVWTLSVVHSVSSSPRFGLTLNTRQTGLPSVPPQCESTCDPVNTILQTGTCPPNECCTTSFQSGYFDCLKCFGAATNATNSFYAQAQVVLDNITVSCFQDGFTLPELTLPGQNPNRTLATSLTGSRTSAGTTHSQITISALSSSSTNAQQTVTALSTQPSATQPSSAGPSIPTSSTNAAMRYSGGFDTAVGLLGLMVFFWTMN